MAQRVGVVVTALAVCGAWVGAAVAAPPETCDPQQLGVEVDQAAAAMSQRYERLETELELARADLDKLRRRAAPLETQPQDATAAVATYDAVERAMLETSETLRQLVEGDMARLRDAFGQAAPARDTVTLQLFDERLQVCEARVRASQQSEPQTPPPPGERPQSPRYRRPGFGRESP